MSICEKRSRSEPHRNAQKLDSSTPRSTWYPVGANETDMRDGGWIGSSSAPGPTNHNAISSQGPGWYSRSPRTTTLSVWSSGRKSPNSQVERIPGSDPSLAP